MAKALSCGMKHKCLSEVYAGKDWDVNATIESLGDKFVGKSINFKLHLENTSNFERTLKMTAQVKAAYYNGGADQKCCHEEEVKAILGPKEGLYTRSLLGLVIDYFRVLYV